MAVRSAICSGGLKIHAVKRTSVSALTESACHGLRKKRISAEKTSKKGTFSMPLQYCLRNQMPTSTNLNAKVQKSICLKLGVKLHVKQNEFQRENPLKSVRF